MMVNDIATEPCPVGTCPRRRRPDRPVCNTHLRRVGPDTVERFFACVQHAKADPNPQTRRTLERVSAEMVERAIEYDAIRADGLHPLWNRANQRWDNPRHHAHEVITKWMRKHRFGLDTENDAAAIESIVAEIFPRQESHAK